MSERDRIVAWLRRLSDLQLHRRYTLRKRLFFVWTALVWPENLFGGCWKATANCIEAGEHLKRREPTIPAE